MSVYENIYGSGAQLGMREGTSWAANFSDNTKNNTSNGERGAKNDFSFWTGCGLRNELRIAALGLYTIDQTMLAPLS